MSETAATRPTEKVTYLGLFDGVNADNQIAAYAMATAFEGDNVLVAVSATAAHPDRSAGPDQIDYGLSRQYQKMHASRFAGMFGRIGMQGCVYLDLPPEQTRLVPIVPHSSHVDHESYDVMNDADPVTGYGRNLIAGDHEALIRRLEQVEGKIRLVVGGGFSLVPHLIQNPNIAPKLDVMTAQAGARPADRSIYAKLSFNGDVDMQAFMYTLLRYPNKILMVPSNITRRPDATFAGHQELAAVGIHSELASMYAQHRSQTEMRHELERARRVAEGLPPLPPFPALAVHDLHAVLAQLYDEGIEDRDLYRFERMPMPEAVDNMLQASRSYEAAGFVRPVRPEDVWAAGYRGDNMTTGGPIPRRLVATDLNGAKFKQRCAELLVPRR